MGRYSNLYHYNHYIQLLHKHTFMITDPNGQKYYWLIIKTFSYAVALKTVPFSTHARYYTESGWQLPARWPMGMLPTILSVLSLQLFKQDVQMGRYSNWYHYNHYIQLLHKHTFMITDPSGQKYYWLIIKTFSYAVAPKIVPFSTHALLQRGERVTITCTMAKGDVPLNILWLKDGSSLSGDDDKVKILTFDHFNSMLTIESLELRHVGNYTCQAANLAGTASHSQAVLVNGKTLGENSCNISLLQIVLRFCFRI